MTQYEISVPDCTPFLSILILLPKTLADIMKGGLAKTAQQKDVKEKEELILYE